MGEAAELKHNGALIRYDPTFLDPMEPGLFDVAWLRRNGLLRGHSVGRNRAYFLSYEGREMALRRFRRGGFMGKLNKDRYFRIYGKPRRSVGEFELLQWMRAQGLPVPRPVAAWVRTAGIFYRTSILTERIQGARPLQDLLAEGGLWSGVWSAVGVAVGQMHARDVCHTDLNCRNILIDEAQAVWLIDFDKCDRREAGTWKAGNLDRLRRSLRHETAWDDSDWPKLIEGYKSASQEFGGV